MGHSGCESIYTNKTDLKLFQLFSGPQCSGQVFTVQTFNPLFPPWEIKSFRAPFGYKIKFLSRPHAKQNEPADCLIFDTRWWGEVVDDVSLHFDKWGEKCEGGGPLSGTIPGENELRSFENIAQLQVLEAGERMETMARLCLERPKGSMLEMGGDVPAIECNTFIESYCGGDGRYGKACKESMTGVHQMFFFRYRMTVVLTIVLLILVYFIWKSFT